MRHGCAMHEAQCAAPRQAAGVWEAHNVAQSRRAHAAGLGRGRRGASEERACECWAEDGDAVLPGPVVDGVWVVDLPAQPRDHLGQGAGPGQGKQAAANQRGAEPVPKQSLSPADNVKGGHSEPNTAGREPVSVSWASSIALTDGPPCSAASQPPGWRLLLPLSYMLPACQDTPAAKRPGRPGWVPRLPSLLLLCQQN